MENAPPPVQMTAQDNAPPKPRPSKKTAIIAAAVVIIIIAAAATYLLTGMKSASQTSTTTVQSTTTTQAVQASPNLTSWQKTSSYPANVSSAGCAISGEYLYCVGGFSFPSGMYGIQKAYYASVSSAGITNWQSTTPYPTNMNGPSCIAYNSYLYCIGGQNQSTSGASGSSSLSYYAPVSSSGIGTWQKTTSYPFQVFGPDCSTSNGYIYCIGGSNSTVDYSNITYFAQLSPSGIGAWQPTTRPTLYTPSQRACSLYSGYIYCTGGNIGFINFSGTISAPVSGSGIGKWARTTSYPTSDSGQNCNAYNGYIYCIGGYPVGPGVYFASMDNGAVGNWTKGAQLPANLTGGCYAGTGYLYCIGVGGSAISGNATASYFAKV
jgi:hypothetical protein